MKNEALLTPTLERPAARTRARVSHVRLFGENDLEPAAALFLDRFREDQRGAKAQAEVAAYLKRLYLDCPTRTGDPTSLVAVGANGDIGGFVGCMRATFQFEGRPIKAGVTGTLMASAAPEHAFAAVQLLRESRNLDLDLLFTDTANRASLAMCQAMNYRTVAPDSLEWAFVFKPAELALSKASSRLRLGWLKGFRPLARVADWAAAPTLRAALGDTRVDDWTDAPVDADAFIAAASRLMQSCRFGPRYDVEEFSWLVGMAGERRSVGPLHLRVVRDAAGQPTAAYAAYGENGGVSRVFFCVAAPNAWGRLFARMIETARETGCVAIHGPLRKPMLPHAYATRGAFFYYACGTMAFAKRPEVRDAVEAGEALLGGFAGDRWTRLASDTFG